MKKLLLALAVLVAAWTAPPQLAQADSPTAAETKEMQDRLTDLNTAGVPLDHIIYVDLSKLTPDQVANLKKYKIIKGKNWKGMNADAKKTAIDNAKTANPNYFVDLRTGDVYSISDDAAFDQTVKAADNIPGGILTDDQKRERARLQEDAKKQNTGQGHADARRGGSDHDSD